MEEYTATKKKVMLKKSTLIIIISVLSVIFISSLTFGIYFYGDDVSRQYYTSFLPMNNVYEQIDYNEFENLMSEDEKFLIFYGDTTCLSCKKMITPINNLAKKMNISKIYYIKATSDCGKNFKAFVNENKDNGDSLTVPMPQIFLLKGNKIIDNTCNKLVEDSTGNYCQYNIGDEVISSTILASEHVFNKYLEN